MNTNICKKRNFFLAIFVFFIFYFGLLTGSRSFILSTLLSIGFLLGIKILLFILVIGLIIYLIIFNGLLNFDITVSANPPTNSTLEPSPVTIGIKAKTVVAVAAANGVVILVKV